VQHQVVHPLFHMSSSLPSPASLEDASLAGTSLFRRLRVALLSAARYTGIHVLAHAIPARPARVPPSASASVVGGVGSDDSHHAGSFSDLKLQNILLSKKIQRNALEICQLTQECERLSIELKTTQVMPSIQSPVTILRVSHVLFCHAPLTLHYHAPFSPLLISLDPALHPSPFNAESRRCSYSFSNRSSS